MSIITAQKLFKLAVDNEKYELTNFVIDHLINYLEKDDSILHNIGHPVCYFLSKMDQNTPVFLELFLNNGLNVDSQFSYNNKQNLYLLDYFSIDLINSFATVHLL